MCEFGCVLAGQLCPCIKGSIRAELADSPARLPMYFVDWYCFEGGMVPSVLRVEFQGAFDDRVLDNGVATLEPQTELLCTFPPHALTV